MLARLGAADRRAAIVGVVTLLVVVAVYLFVGPADRPLAAFVLPGLLTAVLGGWRATAAVGVVSLAIAVVLGALEPWTGEALLTRLLIIAAAVAMGAIGAAIRERQSTRLADLDEVTPLRAAFERALIPPPNPPPGYVAMIRYRPAEQRLQLGGDFVEAVGLDDGRLAVLIGDVCGHGPREAAFGAALRAGWKAIALSGKHEPADWISALDASFFRDGRIDTYVTLCTGLLDVSARVARLINLGHPPPVVLARPFELLDAPPFHPLGLGFDDDWSATDLAWGGQPTLFYTDGLIENPNARGEPHRWFVDGLQAWLAAHPNIATPQDYADRLIQSATAGRELRDDVALLVVAAPH